MDQIFIMNVARIVTAAVTGTSMMTLFSYWVSRQKAEQFREPVLLSILTKRLFSDKRFPQTHVDGWALHYSVGAMFCLIYDRIWQQTGSKPKLLNAGVLGLVSGIFGATVWKMILHIHPDPPNIKLKKYYGHLVAAHVIFGIFSAAGYRLATAERKQIMADAYQRFSKSLSNSLVS